MEKDRGVCKVIPIDNQRIFMEWLDTCPVVEYRSVVDVHEDTATWIYTVDFAVVKEDDDQPQRGH